MKTFTFIQLLDAYNALPEIINKLSHSKLRRYLQAGLLPRASTGGKGALYTDNHLNRLQVISLLREQSPQKTTLRQIKSILDQLTPAIIQGIACHTIPFKLIDDERDDARVVSLRAKSPSERDVWEHAASAKIIDDSILHSPPNPDHIAKLAFNMRRTDDGNVEPYLRILQHSLREYAGDPKRIRKITRNTSEEWHRIRVGPSLEIHIKGPAPEHLKMLQDISNTLNHILFCGHGGTQNH